MIHTCSPIFTPTYLGNNLFVVVVVVVVPEKHVFPVSPVFLSLKHPHSQGETYISIPKDTPEVKEMRPPGSRCIPAGDER